MSKEKKFVNPEELNEQIKDENVKVQTEEEANAIAAEASWNLGCTGCISTDELAR